MRRTTTVDLVRRWFETFAVGCDVDIEQAICGRFHRSGSSVRAARLTLLRRGEVERTGAARATQYGGLAELWRAAEKA